MGFELIIVLALIVLFVVSLCSLLQKIRRAYEHDHNTRRIAEQQIYSVDVPPTYDSQTEISHGVFPSSTAPPAYTEHYDPPPKYDDVIKNPPSSILPQVHQPVPQLQSRPLTSIVTQ